jgi:pyruvate/2-oxoglutarate dehydrogenase complex dihydrolipoamide acyltransferase (E2) component
MSWLTRNVPLGPALEITNWRKVASGTWRTARDPSVYVVLELNAEPALAYLDTLSVRTDTRLTLSHFVGKVVAATLRRHPEINCVLRFGRLYPRRTVDLFFQVATDPFGKDLSGTTIRDADTKSIEAIAAELEAKVDAIRRQGDPEFRRMKGVFGALPGCLAAPLLRLSGGFAYTPNLWSPVLGTLRDSFGSVMITNIGSLGLEMAFAPLVPYSRVPLVIALGALREQPAVVDHQVTVARMITLCLTVDHRLVDGVQVSQMAGTVQDMFANPERELKEVRARKPARSISSG